LLGSFSSKTNLRYVIDIDRYVNGFLLYLLPDISTQGSTLRSREPLAIGELGLLLYPLFGISRRRGRFH
jgi:hypothetical protein